MKKLFLLFCTIFAVQLASAYDACIDGIYYSFSGTEATVTYKDTDYNSYTGDVTIPESVTYNDKTYSVTSIGEEAFNNCSGLTSVTIPASVNTINASAFKDCTGLTKLVYNATECSGEGFTNVVENHWLSGCTNLNEVEIGESVKSVPNYAFYGCTGLTSITIPTSVTSIGVNALSNCTGLTKMNYNSADCNFIATTDEGHWLYGCANLKQVEIGESVKSIPDYTFYNCKGLTSIVFPTSVTTIGTGAFGFCTGLTSISIPASVNSIGQQAFSNCTGVKSVYINDLSAWCRISFLANYANPLSNGADLYLNGDKVEDLVIPEGITAIGESSFFKCSSLRSVKIPSGVTYIDQWAFSFCPNLTNVELPSSITSIGANGFSYCPRLTSINIPNSVKSIGHGAFCSCSGLTDINIPNSLNTIGSSAFAGCSGLKSVTIPASVTEIRNYAFSSCSSLTSVTMSSSSTTIGFGIFSNCIGLTKLVYNATECSGDGFTNVSKNHWLNGCTNLKEVEIGESVKTMAANAFSNCTGLTKLVYNATECSGEGFTNAVENHWLSGCTNLNEVEIGESVKTIPAHVFYDCTAIKSVYISDLAAWCNISFERPDSSPLCYCADLFLKGEKIVNLVIPNDVTTIGNHAFRGCSSLTNVIIPSSVTSIGTDAFCLCLNLKSVSIPTSVSEIGGGAFYVCDALSEVTIPSSVTTIGSLAFSECKSLTNITIPASVKSIGTDAFENCSGLTKLVFNATECKGDGLNSFSTHWLSGCTNLKEVEIGESVKTIPANAFSNCTGLTKLVYNATECSGEGFTNVVENHWLSGCTNLNEVEIGESVKTIWANVFSGCTGITDVTIPASVTYIGNNAFSNCTGLTKLYFNATDCGFTASTPEEHWLYGCTNLNDVEIGESVKSIPANAFYGCKGLTSISLPSSVTTIGTGAFDKCSGLTSVTIPETVTKIEYAAFRDCSGLTKLVYNATDCAGIGFTNVSKYHWLNGCTNLKEVEIGESVKTIPANAFSNCNSLTKLVYNATECSGNGFTNVAENHWLKGCTNLNEVEIGESVKSIFNFAFDGCNGVKSVYISDLSAWCKISFDIGPSTPLYYGADLYLNGEKVEDLVFPENITAIGDYSFYNCSSLKNVNFPSGLTSVGRSAFYHCSGIISINFPTTITEIGEYSFSNCTGLTCVTIPEMVKSIGYSAFEGCTGLMKLVYNATDCKSCSVSGGGNVWLLDCTNLNEIEIGKSVKSIPAYAFSGCSNVKSVYISDLPSWCKISFVNYSANPLCYGADLYLNGEKIEDFVIPEGHTSIGNYSFAGYTGLKSVVIPNSVTSIGSYAFAGCNGLTNVNIPASVTSIGDGAFYGCTGLTNLNIPGSETPADYMAYNGSNDRKKVTEPASGLSIGTEAFLGCSGLKTAKVEAQTVGERAFAGCSNVTDLCINSKEIGAEAFIDMTGLKNVYSLTVMPPTATDDAFSKYDGINLLVPEGATQAYGSAACWKNFLNVEASNFTNLDSIFSPDNTTGIDDAKTETEHKVYASGHSIYVEAESDDIVEIYTLQGTAIFRGVGSVTRDVQGGVYIVRVNNHTTKLMVR